MSDALLFDRRRWRCQGVTRRAEEHLHVQELRGAQCSRNAHLRNEQEGLERGLAEAKGVAGVLGTCGRVRWARRNAVFLCPTFCGMALAAKLAGKKPGQ